jgi:hypothetical protein
MSLLVVEQHFDFLPGTGCLECRQYRIHKKSIQ